jgi:SAM-dependent methyltransferase
MANEAMRTHWTDGTGPHWVRHQRLFDRMIAPFGAAAVDALAPTAGDHVLDVGCGTGATAIAAAERGARVTGADISPTMIEAARARAPQLDFVVADAQTDALGGPYDAVLSRFGVMFFDDPVAAFANIRRACPDGRMAFVCWRSPDLNPVITSGAEVVMAALPSPPPPVDPLAPGPFAFADPGHTRSVLADAGWRHITIEPFDAMCRFDVDGSDGVDERLTLLLGSFTGVAFREQIAPDEQPAVLEAVRRHLASLKTGEVLELPGAVWVVTARSNP